MSEKVVTGECSNCESTYSVEYVEELVATDYPEHCPFCGELIEEITEEYIEDEDSNDDEQWD
jgi:NAD-dependent SIR2 family protein deacetylase